MSFIENSIFQAGTNWALARLKDRNTWVTWIALAAAHFGGVINPALDPLLVNAATAIVAVLGYVVTGSPIFAPKGAGK